MESSRTALLRAADEFFGLREEYLDDYEGQGPFAGCDLRRCPRACPDAKQVGMTWPIREVLVDEQQLRPLRDRGSRGRPGGHHRVHLPLRLKRGWRRRGNADTERSREPERSGEPH